MIALFDRGYNLASHKYSWGKGPTGDGIGSSGAQLNVRHNLLFPSTQCFSSVGCLGHNPLPKGVVVDMSDLPPVAADERAWREVSKRAQNRKSESLDPCRACSHSRRVVSGARQLEARSLPSRAWPPPKHINRDHKDQNKRSQDCQFYNRGNGTTSRFHLPRGPPRSFPMTSE